MNALEEMIRRRIVQDGPMSVSEFMALALGHPQHGYYMKQDPFGTGGDFTTAPEISQMFGEMIGAWIADAWMKCGSPERFILLECGPGRGTLMADILRAAKGAPGFHDAADVHLMETSPVLREKQKETLSGHAALWHETLDSVPDDAPLFVIGNEFFDALPVQQFVYQSGRWYERRIGLESDALSFVACDAPAPEMAGLPAPQDGDIYEHSPLSRSIMNALSGRIARHGGAMLFIDYGYDHDAYGDTLQAVKAHQFAPVLDDIGDCDLTVHVDFAALQRAASDAGLSCYGPVGQGDFLRALGIDVRAHMLQQKASEAQQKGIQDALERLTSHDAMGQLFRVFAACGSGVSLEGFA